MDSDPARPQHGRGDRKAGEGGGVYICLYTPTSIYTYIHQACRYLGGSTAHPQCSAHCLHDTSRTVSWPTIVDDHNDGGLHLTSAHRCSLSRLERSVCCAGLYQTTPASAPLFPPVRMPFVLLPFILTTTTTTLRRTAVCISGTTQEAKLVILSRVRRHRPSRSVLGPQRGIC